MQLLCDTKRDFNEASEWNGKSKKHGTPVVLPINHVRSDGYLSQKRQDIFAVATHLVPPGFIFYIDI